MTHETSKATPPKPSDPVTFDIGIADNGTIRIGGGFRLPPTEIADSARVRVGGGFRLPTA